METDKMFVCINCNDFVSAAESAEHELNCKSEYVNYGLFKVLIKRETINANAHKRNDLQKEVTKYKNLAREACLEMIALKTALQQKAKQSKPHWVYDDSRWNELRYKTFKECGFTCMACNDGTEILHIDHIKPLSKYPELAFEPSNLQVLCARCNNGKSNKYVDNFRSRRVPDEFSL